MSGSGNSGMIDGFLSVQAVRHKSAARESTGRESSRPVAENSPGASLENADGAKAIEKAAIGRTALPTRHDIICYSCGYKFVVTGRLDKLFCPKCREQLETGDYDIEGRWDKDVLTVGRIHIHAGAVVKGATLVAGDIIVGGDCAEATLKPVRQIELETGGVVARGLLANMRLVIRPGAHLSFDETLRCTELDIYGELHAEVVPSGLVTIHAGGYLRGSLQCSRLVVHDGGGLSADLKVVPEHQNSAVESSAKSGRAAIETGHKAEGKTPTKVAALPSKQSGSAARFKPPGRSGGSRLPITLK